MTESPEMLACRMAPGHLHADAADRGHHHEGLRADIEHGEGPWRIQQEASVQADRLPGTVKLAFLERAGTRDRGLSSSQAAIIAASQMRKGPIAPGLHQNIDHIAVFIHGPPQVLQPSLDLHEHLVQIPRVRLEFPILSLDPGLRPRCMAPDVWPTLSRA